MLLFALFVNDSWEIKKQKLQTERFSKYVFLLQGAAGNSELKRCHVKMGPLNTLTLK
jgi:hypothetical protein